MCTVHAVHGSLRRDSSSLRTRTRSPRRAGDDAECRPGWLGSEKRREIHALRVASHACHGDAPVRARPNYVERCDSPRIMETHLFPNQTRWCVLRRSCFALEWTCRACGRTATRFDESLKTTARTVTGKDGAHAMGLRVRGASGVRARHGAGKRLPQTALGALQDWQRQITRPHGRRTENLAHPTTGVRRGSDTPSRGRRPCHATPSRSRLQGLIEALTDTTHADPRRPTPQACPRLLGNEECPHYSWCSRVDWNLILGQRSMVSSRFTREGARYTSAPE